MISHAVGVHGLSFLIRGEPMQLAMELQKKTVPIVVSTTVKRVSTFCLRRDGINVLSVHSQTVSLNTGTKVSIPSSS